MNEVTTTLVVNFRSSTDEGEGISAEIDDREEGYNNGKTSFSPGDSPAYLVYPTSGVGEITNTPSIGVIQSLGSGSRLLTEFVRFNEEKESNVQKPILSINSFEWVGNDLGTVSFDGKKLTVDHSGVAVARIKYNASFRAYRLTNVPSNPLGDGSDFEAFISIVGKVKES